MQVELLDAIIKSFIEIKLKFIAAANFHTQTFGQDAKMFDSICLKIFKFWRTEKPHNNSKYLN